MVEVDQPMKALSMHIQKPYEGKDVKAVILSKQFFFNQTLSPICLMCLHCEGKYQIVPSIVVVGVDQPVYAFIDVILTKIIVLAPNSFMHMFNVSKLCR